MLRDIDRKVLRICYNFIVARNRPPSIHELCIKTGKQTGEIKYILRQLADKQFIQWDSDQHNRMRVIQPWEFKFGK